jgi:hypothetical protein
VAAVRGPPGRLCDGHIRDVIQRSDSLCEDRHKGGLLVLLCDGRTRHLILCYGRTGHVIQRCMAACNGTESRDLSPFLLHLRAPAAIFLLMIDK